MAMRASGGYGGGSYSYTVTETYTLEEAIDKASRGGLDPDEVYRQMPGKIQKEVDRLASTRFGKTFHSLSRSDQCAVMGALATEIKRAKEEAQKPVSILEALRLAAEGEIDDLKLYDALPEEMRKPLDALATALASSDFRRAKRDVRSQVLKVLLQALTQRAGRGASNRGLELHNRALELSSDGDFVEAVNAMRDAEKALTEDADGDPTSQSVALYCNLSSARAHLGDWTNDVLLLHSAIAAADRGLEHAANDPERQDFNRGVLLHNRGHAGWRLGELTRDSATLSRARRDIAEAGSVFQALKRSEAVKENNDLSARAMKSLAGL